jgi:hypothetical protein
MLQISSVSGLGATPTHQGTISANVDYKMVGSVAVPTNAVTLQNFYALQYQLDRCTQIPGISTAGMVATDGSIGPATAALKVAVLGSDGNDDPASIAELADDYANAAKTLADTAMIKLGAAPPSKPSYLAPKTGNGALLAVPNPTGTDPIGTGLWAQFKVQPTWVQLLAGGVLLGVSYTLYEHEVKGKSLRGTALGRHTRRARRTLRGWFSNKGSVPRETASDRRRKRQYDYNAGRWV